MGLQAFLYKNRHLITEIKEIISLSFVQFEPKSIRPKHAKIPNVNDTKSFIRNFMIDIV